MKPDSLKTIKNAFVGGFVLMAIAIPINPLTTAAWPMFMHDAQHTSQSPYSPSSRPRLEWTLPLELTQTAAPVIGERGIIYIGSTDNNLYAISPNGTTLWTYATEDSITASPAVDSNGSIYVGSIDRSLYAVQRNGDLLWSYDVGSRINSSPTIANNSQLPENIYTTSQNGKLHAFSANESHLWSTDLLAYGTSFSSPAITSGNKIALGTLGRALSWSSGRLYLINSDGTTHCSYDTGFWKGDGVRSSVSITANNNILFATKDSMGWGPGIFYVIDQDCNRICNTSDLNHHYGSAAIANDGTIYLGTGNGLKALNESCQTLWTAPTGNITHSTPAIAQDGTIYIGANNGNLYAINPDGSIRWQYDLEESLGTPVIGPSGKIYVNSVNNLYAFRGGLTWEAFAY